MFRSPLHHECVVTARERAGTSSASDRERRRGVSPARRPLQPDCAPITPDRAGLLPTKVRPVPFSPVPGPFGGHHHDHAAVGAGPQALRRSARVARTPVVSAARSPNLHRPRLLLLEEAPQGPQPSPAAHPHPRQAPPNRPSNEPLPLTHRFAAPGGGAADPLLLPSTRPTFTVFTTSPPSPSPARARGRHFQTSPSRHPLHPHRVAPDPSDPHLDNRSSPSANSLS